MKSVTTSLWVFGAYMMLVPGIGLMSMPGVLLDVFGLGHDEFLWTARVVGLLAFIIGSYQIAVAKFRLARLYKITVIQRYFAATFFAGLWATGEAEIAILLFALIDAGGASWTLLTAEHGDTTC